MKIDNVITLVENDEMVRSKKEGRHNGIKCPVCEHVLYDSNTNIQLMANPEIMWFVLTVSVITQVHD